MSEQRRIDKALKLYKKAAEAAGKRDLVKRIMALREDEEETAYSAKYIVDIDDNSELANLISANPTKNPHDIIKDYLMQNFHGQKFVLSDGRIAIMDGRDASKLSGYSSPKGIARIGNLHRLIETAKYHHSVYGVTHKKFVDFHYYEATYRYKGVVDNVWLNIGTAKNDGSNHIYDITNKKEETLTSKGDSRPVGNAIQNISSTNSITDSAEKVNSDTKLSRKTVQERSTLDTYAYSGTVKSSSKKDGKLVEIKAQVLNEKVYKRGDVSKAISGIRLFNLLSKQDRTQLVEDTWIALNKAKNSDDRIKAVKDILSKAINYSVTELSSKQTLVEWGVSVESLASDAIINFVKLLNKGQESYKAAVDRRANEYIKEEDAKLKARKTELKANYESDKVYTKSEISKMVESLSGLSSIPKRFRTEIVNDIWTAFNSRYSPGQREMHASFLADKIFARMMQESGDTFDNTSQEDIYAMEREIHKALKKIAREGGSPSTFFVQIQLLDSIIRTKNGCHATAVFLFLLFTSNKTY